MDYTSTVAPSFSKISLVLLTFRTVAYKDTETQQKQKLKYYLLKQLLTH